MKSFWLIALSFLLGSCSEPRLLIHIVDLSQSAVNKAGFLQEQKQVCHGLIDAASYQDLIIKIGVNSDIQSTDPVPVTNREMLHGNCKPQPEPEGYGTFVCPAWQQSLQLINRYPTFQPIIVTQVQTNEVEEFCKDTLSALMESIIERNGIHIVVGSTNDGNTPFNKQLWAALNALPNNRFCHSDVRHCVKQSIEQ